MNQLLDLKPPAAIGCYLLLDAVCIGMGMGVPIFCILLGFPVGWYLARRATKSTVDGASALRTILVQAAAAAGATFLAMAVLWGRCVVMLFDADADLANFGMPLLLFEPRASFIGWLVLMVFIAPFLQLLAMVFGAAVTLARR